MLDRILSKLPRQKDPRSVWTNAGARPGDVLLLTKPLGTGVITTALRAGKARTEWIQGAVKTMSELNTGAAEILGNLRQVVHAATDITGFGLIGHAWEMASAGRVSLRLRSDRIGLLEGALECAQGGFLAGGGASMIRRRISSPGALPLSTTTRNAGAQPLADR